MIKIFNINNKGVYMSNVKAKSIFDKMVEANIEITNLAYENKQMGKF